MVREMWGVEASLPLVVVEGCWESKPGTIQPPRFISILQLLDSKNGALDENTFQEINEYETYQSIIPNNSEENRDDCNSGENCISSLLGYNHGYCRLRTATASSSCRNATSTMDHHSLPIYSNSKLPYDFRGFIFRAAVINVSYYTHYKVIK